MLWKKLLSIQIVNGWLIETRTTITAQGFPYNVGAAGFLDLFGGCENLVPSRWYCDAEILENVLTVHQMLGINEGGDRHHLAVDANELVLVQTFAIFCNEIIQRPHQFATEERHSSRIGDAGNVVERRIGRERILQFQPVIFVELRHKTAAALHCVGHNGIGREGVTQRFDRNVV